MKPSLSLLLALVLACAPRGAHASEPSAPRGWRTGLGLSFLVLGAGGLGLGVAGVLAANEAQARLLTYGAPVDPLDATQTLPVLELRRDTFTALGAVGFAAAGLCLGTAVTLLLLDGRPASVALVPTRDGGFVTFALRL